MNQFINARESVVTEAIDGMLAVSGSGLARLDGFPHTRVVVRNDWDKSKVALVSGGGSGHEPAHAAFVGQGLLTAAVCGDVFASPSVDAVLAGILAVTGKAGCLLIVKNYTGDRLNFGLAAERARALGWKVSMVVVDDDIALPDLPQARGVAGTLFVHKVAGAMAASGESLERVTAAAEKVIKGTASIGMSLGTCTVPGSPKEERIADGMSELGLGIHGEPGVEQIVFDTAAGSIARVIEKLQAHAGDGSLVALINNLGGTTQIEMAILTKELLQSSLGQNIKLVIGPAPLMTSLDMRGFSVSILALDDELEKAILTPVTPVAWPAAQAVAMVSTLPLPDELTPDKPTPSKHPEREALLSRCCDILLSTEADLNALDALSGDGDTGSTLARAARALKASLIQLPLADLTQLYRALSDELSQTMGGSSGVLLAIFFGAAADASASGQDPIESLEAGLARIQEVGGAAPGDRTLIDALAPALAALPDGLAAAATAARTGANHTATIVKAKAGRASYVSADQLRGHNDPGAEAIARLFEQLLDG